MDVCIILVYLTTLSVATFIQLPVTKLLKDSEFKMVCKQSSWPNFRPPIDELTYRDVYVYQLMHMFISLREQ
jgi:hypothetical protein